VASSWILFFCYQEDARSNTHQIYMTEPIGLISFVGFTSV